MAIALDSTTAESALISGAASGSFNFTNTAGNILIGTCITTVVSTGMTYNGVAMSFVGRAARSDAGDFLEIYVLVSPATGLHSLAATFGTNTVAVLTGTSYSGASTSQPDGSDFAVLVGSGTSATSNVTVTAANSWVFGFATADNGVGSLAGSGALTRVLLRDSPNLGFAVLDSNGTVATGSNAYGFTGAAAGSNRGLCAISIAPAVAATTPHLLTLTGAGI